MVLSEIDGEALGFGSGRCENKASGALRQNQLKNINICLKYLIYLITTTPKNVLWKKLQGEKHLLWFFFSLLSIQLDPPLEGHVQDSHGRKREWKAKKSLHPQKVTYSF